MGELVFPVDNLLPQHDFCAGLTISTFFLPTSLRFQNSEINYHV